jgi:hypothetical protein
MLFAEKQLREWWGRRTEDERARLKTAAERHRLDSDTVDLLNSTRCPIGPVGGKWEMDPDWDWSWPLDVQTFITQQ